MLIERADLFFRDELARWIVSQLQGDEKTDGLYRNVLKCLDWESYQRAKIEILTYENVLKQMDKIVREMNEEPQRAAAPTPFRMN